MDSVAKTYDKYAGTYAGYLEERLPQFLLTKFISMLKAGAKVLDAGCAAGRDSIYLAEEGLDVSGIDISSKILRIAGENAKENNLKIDFRKQSIEQTGYDNDSFDGIWCIDTLNHIQRKDIPKVFSEFRRVLKPGGILFLSAVSGEYEGMKRLEYMAEDVFFAEHEQIQIEDGLEKAGFEITESSFEQPNGSLHINIFSRKKS